MHQETIRINMLKPIYVFLWVIVHLTAVELPKALSRRGEAKLPLKELIEESRYSSAIQFYDSLSDIKEPAEFRYLATALRKLGYYDSAYKVMKKRIELDSIPKEEDLLVYVHTLRSRGLTNEADSIINALKTNTDISQRYVFTEFRDKSFLYSGDKFDCLKGSLKRYHSQENNDIYRPIKDPLNETWYYHEKQPVETGLLNNFSSVDAKPYCRIKKINHLRDTLFSTGMLTQIQTWNKYFELNDFDQYGNKFITTNISTVNDENKFVLNIRRMYYDTNLSKIVFDLVGLDKILYNSSGINISPDGKKCVFSSDMYGGYGKSDLWYGDLIYDTYGKVKIKNYYNLGEFVNTERGEYDACFITDDIIAFISDGHMSMGGRDIYFYCLSNQKIISAGHYINSNYEEIGVRFVEGQLYFSSNRINNRYDLYSFPLDKEEIEKVMKDFNEESSVVDSNDSIQKIEDYNSQIMSIIQRSKLKDNDPRKYMYTRGIEFLLMNDSFRLLAINDIDSSDDYRDYRFLDLIHTFEQKDLQPEYEYELNLIAQILAKRNDWMVKVRSHTDSRGDSLNNLRLSEIRAKFISDYLFALGVDTAQIVTEGVGERYPLNHCLNDAPCTEEEYARNRRTELLLMRREGLKD